MFSKLLKHEWKANAGLLGILSLAVFGIGLVATVVLRVLVNYGDMLEQAEEIWPVLAFAALGMMLVFSFVALSVYVVAVQFILLYRFYKNKFTDEGYLTFTLPVKPRHIFWSSFWNMLAWLLIAFLVVGIIVAIVVLFGTATDGLINTELFSHMDEFLEIFQDLDMEMLYGENGSVAYLVLLVLQILIAPFFGLFIPMACITMGAVLAKKHKILASFGIYYAVNFVVGIVTSVATIVPSLLMVGSGETEAYYITSMAIEVAITAALTIGSYFLTVGLMKNKLNLP